MGAWRYCSNCERGLNAPNIAECLTGVQRYPSCDMERDTDSGDMAMAAVDLLERIEALERAINPEHGL